MANVQDEYFELLIDYRASKSYNIPFCSSDIFMAIHERETRLTTETRPRSLQEVMAVSSFAEYKRAIGSVPVYTHNEHAQRFRLLDEARQHGNGPAIQYLTDDLTLHNLRYVVCLANRYQGKGVALEDLVQEGNIGLMRAVERFEVERGFRFTTFSSREIRSRISKLVGQMGNPVRLPEDLNRLSKAVDTTVADLVQKFGTEQISPEQIADRMQIPIVEVDEVLKAKIAQHFRSIQEPVATVKGPQKDYTLEEFLEDRGTTPAYEVALQNHASDEAMRLLAELPRVVGEVIRRRTGIFDGREQTWSEIAEATGRSIDFAKSIYTDGLALLRDNFTADAHGRNASLVTPTSDDEIGNLGLTRKQWTILSMLDSGKCPPTTREFAAQLGMDRKELIAELTRINDLYPLRA